MSSTSALAPRPATLWLTHIDPCQLLTPAQLRRWSLLEGIATTTEDGPACGWQADPFHPGSEWIAQIVLDHGAADYLNSVTGAQQIQVDGFSAVATTSDLALNPELQCLLYLDVAPGQSLEVSYHDLPGDYPGINHQVACQLAVQAAQLMLANLTNLTR